MRKPDDELKIDISEIFGGDMPAPSDTIDETPEPTPVSTPVVEAPVATPSQVEQQFRDWMNNRNAELETKTQELEKRLQDLQNQLASSPAVPPPAEEPESHFTAQELTTAVEPAPAAQIAAPAPDSPIDFSAPIAPPFMGASTPAASAPAATVSNEPAPTGENPAESDPQKIEELKRLQAEFEFLMLYDEFRNMIAHELMTLVGDKKTFTMLGRTVELARTKYPEVFRNANWDAAGNLLEDGSVDSQRILENKKNMDPAKADAVMDIALSSLLKLRLQAVEKGLGVGLKNKIRAQMFQWVNEKTQKAGKEGKNTSYLLRLNSYVTQA